MQCAWCVRRQHAGYSVFPSWTKMLPVDLPSARQASISITSHSDHQGRALCTRFQACLHAQPGKWSLSVLLGTYFCGQKSRVCSVVGRIHWSHVAGSNGRLLWEEGGKRKGQEKEQTSTALDIHSFAQSGSHVCSQHYCSWRLHTTFTPARMPLGIT